MLLGILTIALVNVLVGCVAARAQAYPQRGIRMSVRIDSASPASAPEPLAGPLAAALPTTPDQMIEQMTQQAGVIFAGEVLAVRRPLGYAGSAQDAAEGVVGVDFRVDEAVLGPGQGTIYTLREWAGLWTGGTERYRSGQRVLVFLRSPNAQGLSSPVHGPEGIIPLRGGGMAPGPDSAATIAAEWLVDLRWLHAQTEREPPGVRASGSPIHEPPHAPVSEQGSEPVTGQAGDSFTGDRYTPRKGFALSSAPALGTPWLLDPPSLSSADASMEPLAQVLNLCRNRMKARDAAH